ncbi:MAG: Lrp/AsnC family transcriptional regulator, partial [Nitrospirota bacterium]
SENARVKIKELSVLLKKSSQRLKYSMANLDKEALVSNPHCIFDYSYFGLILFRVYFKGGYISEKDKVSIISQLSENPYVVSLYELSGEFDLAVELESPNPSKFNKELKKVANLIPTLNNYKILLNVVTHIYPRLYLPTQEFLNLSHEIIVGGDRAVESFSPSELTVLKNLLANPKIRLTALAKQCDMNIKTSISILKNLQKRKIIKGFRYLVNTNKLGIFKFRLFLKLHNLSQDSEQHLMNFLLRTEEIIQVSKTVGDWDIEVDIESFDKTRIRFLIIQLREEFRDLIETFNIIEFYQYYQKTYLPKYLFSNENS